MDTTTLSAAGSYARCPNGAMCIFTDSNGGGWFGAFQKPVPNLRHLNAPPGLSGVLNDSVSSFWNRTGGMWCMYKHSNYDSGPGVYAALTAEKANIKLADWNDQISSLRPC